MATNIDGFIGVPPEIFIADEMTDQPDMCLFEDQDD